MNTRRWIAAATALLVLAVMNLQILRSENLLASGRVFYLALAPVDPRSLMQGDYMTLNFELANQLREAMTDSSPQEGLAVVRLDSRGVGTSIAVAETAGPPPEPAALLLHYRRDGWPVLLVTNAYFFEEGQGARYQGATFGEFRADGNGRALLVALTDGQLRRL